MSSCEAAFHFEKLKTMYHELPACKSSASFHSETCRAFIYLNFNRCGFNSINRSGPTENYRLLSHERANSEQYNFPLGLASVAALYKSHDAMLVTWVLSCLTAWEVVMLTYIGGSDGFRFKKILHCVGLFFTNVGGCDLEKAGQYINSVHELFLD